MNDPLTFIGPLRFCEVWKTGWNLSFVANIEITFLGIPRYNRPNRHE